MTDAFGQFVAAASRYRDHREARQYPALLSGDKEKGFAAALAGQPLYERSNRILGDVRRAEEDGARRRFDLPP